ncbi:TetR/AcrR family transcriptional regulator [Nonomuraea sp. NPDC050556]|uniref:TetR/AcrR family transcriptional regulator n=1 Tax=Nonomuraea sp. NPDC050556 TaxID=3364369 RepID=UPI00379F478E
MPRPTRQQIDDEILDRAAGVFARNGFKQASVQSIADASGYSKTGLLHRFPTKAAIKDAVLDRCLDEVRAIGDVVGEEPAGAQRDLKVVEALTDLALRRPGLVALLLSVATAADNEDISAHVVAIAEGLFGLFRITPGGDLEREARVFGALGALAVTTLAYQVRPPGDLRPVLVAITYNALGHPHVS